jgi:hypothetical protein
VLDCLVVADDGFEPVDVRGWIFVVMRFGNGGRRGGPRGFGVEDRGLEFVVAFLRVLVLLLLGCFDVRWICWTCLRVLFVLIFGILCRRDYQYAGVNSCYGRKWLTLNLRHVNAEMVALFEYALTTLIDEKVESLSKASHAIAQVVKTEFDAGKLVDH